jgi:hypothetical protein
MDGRRKAPDAVSASTLAQMGVYERLSYSSTAKGIG